MNSCAVFPKRWVWKLTLAVCLFSLAGCSLFERKGPEKPQHSGFISVRLASPVPKRGHTFARVTRLDGKKNKTVGFKSVSKDGAAAFVVLTGETYEVCIFCDVDGNEMPDGKDPIAYSGPISPQPITTPNNVALVLDFGTSTPVGVVSNDPAPIQKKQPRDLPPAIDERLKEVPDWIREAVGE